MKKIICVAFVFITSCSLYSFSNEKNNMLNYLSDNTFARTTDGIQIKYTFQQQASQLQYTEGTNTTKLLNKVSDNIERKDQDRIQMKLRYKASSELYPSKIIIIDYYEPSTYKPESYAVFHSIPNATDHYLKVVEQNS